MELLAVPVRSSTLLLLILQSKVCRSHPQRSSYSLPWAFPIPQPVVSELAVAQSRAVLAAVAQPTAQLRHFVVVGEASPTRPMLPFVVGDCQCKGWSVVLFARVWVAAWVVVLVSGVSVWVAVLFLGQGPQDSTS